MGGDTPMAGSAGPGGGHDPWQDVPRRRGRTRRPRRPSAAPADRSDLSGAPAPAEPDPWKDVPRRTTMGDRVMERLERRRARIAREIAGENRGRVPTWVLGLALVAFVAAWVLLIVVFGS
jgi:hypothetical protein